MPERYLMGLFTNEDQVVCTVGALKKSVYQFHRVNSSFFSHKIMAALKLKKEIKSKRVILVLSGSNITLEQLRKLL